MSDKLAQLTGDWSTSVLPTRTTLTHIDPTNVYGLIETLMSLSSAYPTVTKNLDLYHMARAAKGAKASLLVISAQNYIATATATQELPRMTLVIWNATMELQDLEMGFNLYQMDLSLVANLVFAVVFAVVFVLHVCIALWKRHIYFSTCVAVGVALEFAGYVARLLLIGNYLDKSTFLFQIISLTLAPAFIMAGVYYLLAQLLVVHGRQYSLLRPLWFSYIFIFCDLSSLAIQAGGGGTAAIKLQNLESTQTGTHVMVAGIAFQVLSMSLFLYLLFDFLFRIYFRASPQIKFLFPNTFRLAFQTRSGRNIAQEYLQPYYNQKYTHIWSRPNFGYYPLVLFLSVFFIYIRCVYRLVELSEGWTGYLITHEEYVMTLDALMVLITCIILIPFHPGFMMGARTAISMSDIKDRVSAEEPKRLFETTSSNDSYSDLKLEVGAIRVYELQVSSHDSLASSSPFIDATEPHSPVNDGGIVTIPYDQTEALANDRYELPHSESPKNPSRKPRKFPSIRNSAVSTVGSLNPYERHLTEHLSTLGPYEQYRTKLQENPFSDGDNSDIQSQITHDEFLFIFEN